MPRATSFRSAMSSEPARPDPGCGRDSTLGNQDPEDRPGMLAKRAPDIAERLTGLQPLPQLDLLFHRYSRPSRPRQWL
jgi:hypothetical protein